MKSHSAEPHRKPCLEELGDFTTTARVIPISLLAITIGVLSTFVAWFLLKLIGFVTNLAYYHRFDSSFASPAGNQLGVYAIAVPVVGALIVGLMARYGSERIRGHGIPEAIESILMNGSRVIRGWPFLSRCPRPSRLGQMIGQFFHLTSVERRTLLVAGACAGMSATFAAQRHSRGAGERHGLRGQALPAGAGAAFSRPRASGFHRTLRTWRLRYRWSWGRDSFRFADPRSLCG
jgi:hypothetical protein